MAPEPTTPPTITLDGHRAAALVRLLRELERFFDSCDETTADAIADFFAFRSAAAGYSAVIGLHADSLETVLGTEPFSSRL
ncbi:hypothetical protein [Streptomyces lavendulocolor]|uniref:hypothetical protein n=1 Tax=Streptomyces lavendulocolor TaxID=67316 RepID=UPI0033D5CCC9